MKKHGFLLLYPHPEPPSAAVQINCHCTAQGRGVPEGSLVLPGVGQGASGPMVRGGLLGSTPVSDTPQC